MIRTKGHITISRPSPGDEVEITLHDRDAGCRAAVFTMSLSAFAEALTGRGHTEGVLEFNDSGKIGKIREYKQVHVELPGQSYATSKDDVRRAVAVHEVDGWVGRDRDAINGHNRVKLDDGRVVYRVSYERWVDRPEGTDETP